MITLEVQTQQRAEMVDITRQVQKVISESRTNSGLVWLYVPHTTAGITINENADPTVRMDLLSDLDRLVSRDQPYYRHAEGNSDSHMKASLVGSSVAVMARAGELVLGTWQGIFFCEFDGPRRRRVLLEVMPAGDGQEVQDGE